MSDNDIRILSDFSIVVPDRHIYHLMGYGSGLRGVTDTIRDMVKKSPEKVTPSMPPA